MSDTFDHEGEAWASLDWDWEDGEVDTHCFIKSPPYALHFHKRVQFVSVDGETEKSLLINFGSGSLWIPRKIMRCLDRKNGVVWLHRHTFNEIVRTYKERKHDSG